MGRNIAARVATIIIGAKALTETPAFIKEWIVTPIRNLADAKSVIDEATTLAFAYGMIRYTPVAADGGKARGELLGVMMHLKSTGMDALMDQSLLLAEERGMIDKSKVNAGMCVVNTTYLHSRLKRVFLKASSERRFRWAIDMVRKFIQFVAAEVQQRVLQGEPINFVKDSFRNMGQYWARSRNG